MQPLTEACQEFAQVPRGAQQLQRVLMLKMAGPANELSEGLPQLPSVLTGQSSLLQATCPHQNGAAETRNATIYGKVATDRLLLILI